MSSVQGGKSHEHRQLNNERSNISSDDLTTRALSIVLNHLLAPNLGWNISIFDDDLLSIQNQIIELSSQQFGKQEPAERSLQQLKNCLQNERGYFDKHWFGKIYHELNQVAAKDLLPTSLHLEVKIYPNRYLL